MSRRGRIVISALVVAFAGLAAVAIRQRVSHRSEPSWNVPRFCFVDQANRRVCDGDLRGKPWIADFIFTSCSSACPLLSARMTTLQHRLAGATVGFVSFSVDPSHDTPAVLAGYARQWHADPRWRLLATTPDGLHALAAGLKTTVQPTGTAGDPILHSTRFVLVDSRGDVRGLFDSDDDAAMNRLIAEAAELARSTPVSLPTDGKALFSVLGCAGCHRGGGVARPLDGLYRASVVLDDGRRIVADDGYIRESIIDPSAKLVAGYPPTMPSYASQLDRSRLETLVGYVESLAPTQRAQSTAAP
jgi:cytochrome oxidase Cu insertion factor (SCO1/SenC/PrrC family)